MDPNKGKEREQRIKDAVLDFATAMQMTYSEAYTRLIYALPTEPSSKVALEVLFRPLREKTAEQLRRLQGKEGAGHGE